MPNLWPPVEFQATIFTMDPFTVDPGALHFLTSCSGMTEMGLAQPCVPGNRLSLRSCFRSLAWLGCWFLLLAGNVPLLTAQATDDRKSPPTDAQILKFLCGEKLPGNLESHPELLAEVFRAGPLREAKRYREAIACLAAMAQEDPQVLTDEQCRRTAVAIALEFASPYLNKPPEDAVQRYRWYRDAQKDRRLHPSYDQLQTWERRFVVNLPWHHGGGTNQDLDWLNLHVKLPPLGYRDACWQAPYRSFNPFGETVQGPLYYVPFQDSLEPYEMRREVGAVCGGLSHYGAAAARANGIGATTMGEPGHCSYAIRVDGQWLPAYSLSEDRNAHQTTFHAQWPYVVLQETTLKDPQRNLEALRLAGEGLMLAESSPKQAARCLVRACQVQPTNPLLWEIRFQLLQAAGLSKPESWWEEGRALGEALKGYPWVVVQTVRSVDTRKEPFPSAGQRARFMAAALQEAMGPGTDASPACSWKKLFDNVYQFAGSEPKIQQSLFQALSVSLMRGPDQQHFFEDSLARYSDRPEWLSPLMEQAVAALRSKSGPDKAGPARIAEAGMKLAADSANTESFQQFANLHPAPHTENLPRVQNPFPGAWLSRHAAIRFSSTSHWDRPEGHANVLSMEGGRFHTGNALDEWAEVILPRVSKLSGIIIDNQSTFRERAVPLVIEVSVDREHWEPIYQTDQSQAQWVIPLSDKAPTARFIRVHGSTGRQDFLHFRRILIYGKPQS